MNEPAALLLIDIVDSTRLTEELGDAAMADVWARHNGLARDLLRPWRGQELEKADGFLFRFPTPQDAVGYVTAYHEAVEAMEPALHARVGMHVGPVVSRINPADHVELGAKPVEFAGLAIPVVARLMFLAQGGQTLLTADAHAALGAGARRCRSFGHWVLKGVPEPVEVFELQREGVVHDTPPESAKAYRVARHRDLWLPVRDIAHTLPGRRDAFIGRRGVLEALASRLAAGARLVTVLGPGGVGKTRLSQEFGWRALGNHPGGVWFCDLSPAVDRESFFAAVARGLNIVLDSSDPQRQLGTVLASRRDSLIILDNFEQIAALAPDTLDEWVGRAADAVFLVTSRQALNLPGEVTLFLDPLDSKEGQDLFLERAAAISPHPWLTDEDRSAIAPLVKLLDGLPLGIELAAARTRVIPPHEVLKRMSERFRLLVGSGRSDRQATLRGAMDWSWDLLSAAERAALSQLSVFDGGFSLDAAEAFLDLSGCARAPAPIDLVQSLLEKSLVRRVAGARFDLLRTVQDYGLERLRAPEDRAIPGDGESNARLRHWRYFAQLSARLANDEELIDDTENLIAACRAASGAADTPAATGCLEGAWRAIKLTGQFNRGVELATLVRGSGALGPLEACTVDWVEGSALAMQNRIAQAIERFRASLAAAKLADDRRAQCRALCALGDQLGLANVTGEASEALQAALQIAQALPEPILEIRSLNALAALALDEGDLEEATHRYDQALRIAEHIGERRWQGGLHGNIGALWYTRGHLYEARDAYERAMAFTQQSRDRRWEGNLRCNFGLLLHDLGESDRARQTLDDALQLARSIGHVRLECTLLCNLGIVAEAQARLDDAIEGYQGATDLAQTLGDSRLEREYRRYLALALARAERYDAAHETLAAATAPTASSQDPTDLGLVRCTQAEVFLMQGRADEATTAIEKAREIAAALDERRQADLVFKIEDLSERIANLEVKPG